jgi:hypothetical protein
MLTSSVAILVPLLLLLSFLLPLGANLLAARIKREVVVHLVAAIARNIATVAVDEALRECRWSGWRLITPR